MSTASSPRVPTRAWVVWGVAVFAYAVAVIQRASLGVSGVEAQSRFSAGASAISLFVVLQLAVYAALQVPVGVLLDRLGSRVMLVAGALTMAAGQLALALAGSVPGAVGARVLVGIGDAMTFISVLRVVSRWFPGSRVPVLTQLTSILGQLGQIAAAYPLVAVLGATSWTTTFAGAAATGLLSALLVAVALRDAPAGTAVAATASLTDVRVNLAEAFHEPGTRLGFFTHLVTQFSGAVFGLLWGFPFLTLGEGLSEGVAAVLLSLLVVVGMGFGPLSGQLVGRWPLRRSALVLGIAVLGTNGPGSMIGFDYARTENPAARLGSASGVVNVGGFAASLLLMLGIGVVLDLLTPGGSTAYGRDAFRVAFALQYPLWVVGLLGVLRHRRLLRERLARGGVVIAPLHVAVRARLSGGSAYPLG